MFLRIARPKTVAAIALAAALSSASGAYAAGSNNVNFNVKANVVQNCVIVIPDLLFTTTFSGQQQVTSSTSVTVTCNAWGGITPTVVLSGGQNYTGGSWHMKAATATTNNQLGYQMYSDAAMTKAWTSATALPYTGNLVWVGNIYGQIYAPQVVAVDSYSDQIQATVNF